MRPLFLWSAEGDLLHLALRFKEAGVPVTLYIHHKPFRDVGAGVVPKTDNPMPPKNALVLFDGVGHGDLGKVLRQRGQLVIGANPLDKDLETNRAEGIQIMREAGITVPPTKSFTSVAGAETFLEGVDGEWFIKVSGARADCASTCNADKATMLRYLRWVGTQPGDKSFILQQKVDGVEVSTNGWFDGQRFVPPFDGTFEDKKLLAGDLGPRTGCEANVVWLHGPTATLPAETVERITGVLATHGYVGPIDLNAIVAKDGTVYGLEWTARLGFDATQAWRRFFGAKELAGQLEAFATGDLHRWEIPEPKHLAVTLRVSIPPYPDSSTQECAKMSGFPLDQRWLSDDRFDPSDVKRGDGGPVLAGTSGCVGVVGAIGPTFRPLLDDVRDIADSLRTPGKQYRIDPLERAEADWKTLRGLGKL